MAKEKAKKAAHQVQAEEERQEQIDKDNAEDAEELKKVEEMDAVNEESKANLADALAGKMAKEKAKKAAHQVQAEEERQEQIDKDNAEDAEELKKVEEMDAVNEESKANLADKLAGKMAAQKQQTMDKAEDAAELKKVEEMDAVNEESKAAVADIIAKKKQDMEEEEVMAASPDVVSPGGGAEGYEKTKAIYMAFTVQAAMNKLYSDDPCRHVIIRVDEKKKSRGRKKYYAELASAGEENLAAVQTIIDNDPKQIYFSFLQIDTTDASGSNRTKYAFSQYIGEGVGPNTRAAVMSYLGELKKLCKKEDITIMGVDSTNYKTEYVPKNLADALHRSGSHKPDCYLFGSMGEYRMEN